MTPRRIILGNVGVSDGRIATITDERLDAREVLDARGGVVLPGLVDLHVHFNEPGRAHWEGWGPGSRAGAVGGVTTVVEMPLNAFPPTTTREAFAAKVAAAGEASVVDFALWGGLITDNTAHLADLAGAGVIGFKAFMTESGTPDFTYVEDGVLAEGMRRIAGLGSFLAVHAENDAIVKDRTARLRAAGRRDREAWGASRPPLAELEAIHRAIFLARETGCRLHVVHCSVPEGVAMVRAAKASGQLVTVETCSHYLTLTEEDLVRLGPVAKCAPPLKDRRAQEGLWEAVLGGDVDCVTSDHSPCPTEDKARGDDDIFEAWGGITGIQTLLPVMLTEGVHRRGMTLEHLTALVAANPAKIAGLWPRKGAIQVGADADLVVVDLDREWRVERDWLESRHRHSPFVDYPMRGWVRDVVLRGRLIVREGEVAEVVAGGEFLLPVGR